MNEQRTITIVVDDYGTFSVTEDDRKARRLSWEEMLATVVELTHPRIGEARCAMRRDPQDVEHRLRLMEGGL